MGDLYNFQIGFRAAIYRLYRYSTPAGALNMTCYKKIGETGGGGEG